MFLKDHVDCLMDNGKVEAKKLVKLFFVIWVRDDDVLPIFFQIELIKVHVKLIKERKDGGMKLSVRSG